MSKMLNKAVRLKNVSSMNTQTVEGMGRYIKNLMKIIPQLEDDKLKIKYNYELTRSLQKLNKLIQVKLLNTKPTNKRINEINYTKLIDVVNSNLSVSNDRYSFVDIESLRNMNTLNKVVSLKKDVVLPINVKSFNNQYNFKTQIMLTPNNILSYASNGFDIEANAQTKSIPIYRVGEGIRNNELLENKNYAVNR